MKLDQGTFIAWLQNEEQNSQQEICSLTAYKVNEFEVRDKSIYVDYEFLTVDWTADEFEMFKMVDDWLPSQQFPKFIHRIRMKEEYSWSTPEEMCQLTQEYLRETLDIEYSDEPWDSPDISDEFLNSFIDGYDRYCLGEALVENEGADGVLPDYVPPRLRPIFEDCVRRYKQSAQ